MIDNTVNSDVDIIATDDVKAFLAVPYDLYRGDSQWHAPLRFERAEQISTKKNPIARDMVRQMFLAKKSGKVVGRIMALINPAHQAVHGASDGHFGYFDSINDPEVAKGLFEAAANWLRGQDATKMIGPTSHSVNEECGVLVDGFDTPNVLMMPHGRPYYNELMTGLGFEKATNMFAFEADLYSEYTRSKFLDRLLERVEKDDGIVTRDLDMKNFEAEVDLVMAIFNDAWSENWGFVPFTDEQITHMAKELKPLIFKEGLQISFIDGEAAAFIWMIPNLNEAIRDIDGKLLPFGWAKLAWRLKVSGVKTARVPLMGLVKKHQGTKRGLGALTMACDTVFQVGRSKGFKTCELSWILEDNKGMLSICDIAQAKKYKTYRMYEKAL